MTIFRKVDYRSTYLLYLLFYSAILTALHICHFITLLICISESACSVTSSFTSESAALPQIFAVIFLSPVDSLCNDWSFCYRN